MPQRQQLAAGALLALFATTAIRAADPGLLEAAEEGLHAPSIAALAAGEDPNRAGPDGTTPIMWAAYHGDLALVEALIAAGADVTPANAFGTSAITEAAIIGHAGILAALLAAGADPNFENPEGETPLLATARTGRIDAAQVLLEAGADMNAAEEWGSQTAIMWAAARSNPDMVRYLAAYGSESDAIGVYPLWTRKIQHAPRPKD
jgi:ankyrin repeat protein